MGSKETWVYIECPEHGKQKVRQRTTAFGMVFTEACPLCPDDGSGVITPEDVKAELMRQRYEDLLFGSGLPREYRTKMFSTFEQTEAIHGDIVDTLKDLVERDIRTVLLYGSTGVGKTHLLASTVLHASQWWKRSLYVRESDIINEVRATFGSGGPISVIKKYSNVPILCIDEVDKSYDTEYTKSVMFDILDSRTANGRKTVLAGNITGNEFKLKFGDALLSRFAFMGKAFLMTGKDRRKGVQADG